MRHFTFDTLKAVAPLLLALVLQLGFAQQGTAQGSKGVIKGHVADASGGVLQGAQIALEPRSLIVASDVLGAFLITDLEPGSYTLTISYVGFTTATQTVNVVAGQTANADARLDV